MWRWASWRSASSPSRISNWDSSRSSPNVSSHVSFHLGRRWLASMFCLHCFKIRKMFLMQFIYFLSYSNYCFWSWDFPSYLSSSKYSCTIDSWFKCSVEIWHCFHFDMMTSGWHTHTCTHTFKKLMTPWGVSLYADTCLHGNCGCNSSMSMCWLGNAVV